MLGPYAILRAPVSMGTSFCTHRLPGATASVEHTACAAWRI